MRERWHRDYWDADIVTGDEAAWGNDSKLHYKGLLIDAYEEFVERSLDKT